MSDQSEWGTQSKISHRPKFMSVEPQFFVCGHCGNLVVQGKAENNSLKITCCGQTLSKLVFKAAEASSEEHLPVYAITGGFANNAVKVEIGRALHPMTEEHHIKWVYLYTFQGGQIKYLTTGQDPVVIFALADEDAFVYCDRPICKMGREHCMFKCKRGFAIYAYCSLHGLWKVYM